MLHMNVVFHLYVCCVVCMRFSCTMSRKGVLRVLSVLSAAVVELRIGSIGDGQFRSLPMASTIQPSSVTKSSRPVSMVAPSRFSPLTGMP